MQINNIESTHKNAFSATHIFIEAYIYYSNLIPILPSEGQLDLGRTIKEWKSFNKHPLHHIKY